MSSFIRKNAKKLVAVGVAVYGAAANAALTAPSLSTTDFETVAGAVIVALGVMWAIKKALGLVAVR